jgi:F-type H+-transporting ATPase subunit gamma
MAQLITLKQRIKTIITIKKTTNAMRLISMSHHTRMRIIKTSFDVYKKELLRIYNKMNDMLAVKNISAEESTKQSTEQVSSNQIINNNNQQTTNQTQNTNNTTQPVIYIIGSQKGVCGTFNTFLLHFVKKDIELMQSTAQETTLQNTAVYTIGKQMHEQAKEQKFLAPIFITTISTSTIKECVAIIIKRLAGETAGQKIIFYANYPKTFFVQRPTKTTITTPILQAENDPIAAKIEQILFKSEIQSIVVDSLLAEHAARFISMDSSTQNADKIITQLKLDYNKLRQALITRELTELTTTLGMLEE